MFEGRRILVVDDSRTMLELLKTILVPLHREVITAEDVAGACEQIGPNVDLVLCDVGLPDGTGFDVLARATELGDAAPHVILMTARFREEDRERARALGAIGYLAKPISLPEVRRAWSQHVDRRRLEPRAHRRRVVVQATILGEEAGLLRLVAIDVSRSGAFLASPGPLPVGTKLALAFAGEGGEVRATATVTRVQEPTWQDPPGIAVHFDQVEEDCREAFDRLVGAPDRWEM